MGQFEAAYDAPRIPYPGDPREPTPQQLAELGERIRQLETQGIAVEPVGKSGWRDSRITAFSESIAERIDHAVDEAAKLAVGFMEQANRLRHRFGVREPTTIDSIPELVELAEHINRSPGVPASTLRDPRWDTPPPDATELIEQGRRVTAFGARLDEKYRRELLESVTEDDLRYVEGKLGSASAFLSFLAPRYRDVRRRLVAMRRTNRKVRILDQVADLKSVPNWKRECETLTSHAQGPEWFGAAWRGPTSDWDELQKRLVWLARFHELAARHGALGDGGYEVAERGGQGEPLPDELATTARSFSDALTRLRDLLAWPEGYLQKEPVASNLARLAEVTRDARKGASWAAFVRSANGLAHTPAASIGEAAYAGRIPTSQAGRAFRRALYGGWLDLVLPTIPTLADFTAEIHEDHRRRFQKLDSQLLSEKRGELVSRLRETGQRRYASSSATHRTFLAKELAKQKRHRPLRVMLREAREAVMALKPCLLMSPLSVSQFLVPASDFDLVVFDEASQLPTEDAVAAICRGKQLVVVGDPKQLPPTDFFAVQAGTNTAQLDDNGEPVLEETESVLEEFQGIGLHQAHLEWHYRSAHQSLIQFSNEKFYGNRLIVFPSAASESPDHGVRFEFVEGGQYVGAGLNPVEARRIAEAVAEHFRKTPDLTLGVGTFSQRQQMAVWDELERIRREDTSLEEFFDRAKPEPFFVKNLENIQGDERDVIFLSVTYGRQADGKLRYNFGPLNRENGWRRLNVLVTRARQQMRVFSSLRAADINPSSVATQGPALLADFLRYAETGKLMATSTGTAADAESPFESEVGETLEDLGFLVDYQVGVGTYRIDMGVRHRDRPGIYLAGIECDGAAYHAAPCARDRDRLRQYVLEQRGWVIVRVWSTDWFRDRSGTLERLKHTLDGLLEHAAEGEAETRRLAAIVDLPSSSVDSPRPAIAAEPVATDGSGTPQYVRPGVPVYRKASAAMHYRGSLAEASPAHVALEAARVVTEEGPIHHEKVVDRLIELWNHERRGSRLVLAAEEGIRYATRPGVVSRKDGFLFAEAQPIRPRNREGLGQGAEWVSLDELAEAARQVLERADSMSEDELAAEVREVLGLRRTQEGAPRIKQAIQVLIESGSAVYGVAGLRLRRLD